MFGMLQVYSLQLQINVGACQVGIQKRVNTAHCTSVAALFLLYQRRSLSGQKSLHGRHRAIKEPGKTCRHCLLAPEGCWELVLTETRWQLVNHPSAGAGSGLPRGFCQTETTRRKSQPCACGSRLPQPLLGLAALQWETQGGFDPAQCQGTVWSWFLQPLACSELELVPSSTWSPEFWREPPTQGLSECRKTGRESGKSHCTQRRLQRL